MASDCTSSVSKSSGDRLLRMNMISIRWTRYRVIGVSFVLVIVFLCFVRLIAAGFLHSPEQVNGEQLAADVQAGKVSHIVTRDGSSEIDIFYYDSIEPKHRRLLKNTNISELLKFYNADPTMIPITSLPQPSAGTRLSTMFAFYLPPLLLLVGAGLGMYIITSILLSRASSRRAANH